MSETRFTLNGLTCAVLAIVFVGVAQAEESKGLFTALAADQESFVITDVAKKDHTFHLGPNARVLIDDRPGKMSDVRKGDFVVVMWEMQGNRKVASVVICKKQKVTGR